MGDNERSLFWCLFLRKPGPLERLFGIIIVAGAGVFMVLKHDVANPGLWIAGLAVCAIIVAVFGRKRSD